MIASPPENVFFAGPGYQHIHSPKPHEGSSLSIWKVMTAKVVMITQDLMGSLPSKGSPLEVAGELWRAMAPEDNWAPATWPLVPITCPSLPVCASGVLFLGGLNDILQEYPLGHTVRLIT